MPGCYPPPALSNYSSATDLQLKGLVLQPQIVIFMPERPVVRSDWEYQSLDPVPGRIQASHLLRASSEPGVAE
jgi:hypothetical protein